MNVRIIEIDCIYEQLENPEVRKIFADLLNMRKRGYSSRHPHGSLALDTYDFIGTHYVMAIETGKDEHELVGCVRMMKRSRAQTYNLVFPAVSLAATAKSVPHSNFLTTLFQENEKRDPEPDYTYVSSWSFEPSVRENPELVKHLYDLFCTVNVYSQPNPAQDIRVACGIPRLKTDVYIMNAGYERARNQDGPLPEIHQANLIGEPVVLLVLPNGHNFEYRRLAKKNERVWDERLVLNEANFTARKKKAA